MQVFITYFRDYLKSLNISTFLLITSFTALLIIANYRFGIERRVYSMAGTLSLLSFIILYLGILVLNYFFLSLGKSIKSLKHQGLLITLLVFAAVIYGASQIRWQLPLSSTMPVKWRKYWQIVLVTPSKLVFVAISLRLVWGFAKAKYSFFGLTSEHFKPSSYLKILVLFIPAVAFVSIQHDFLLVYPKVKNIMSIADSSSSPWLYELIFEISYGLDFVNTEFFFRGFLILGLCRFAGPGVILPMASLYCCIHFGKPILECVSSYFGGIALGIIAYRAKSIWGGLVIHLGIAWLMEFFSYANLQWWSLR